MDQLYADPQLPMPEPGPPDPIPDEPVATESGVITSSDPMASRDSESAASDEDINFKPVSGLGSKSHEHSNDHLSSASNSMDSNSHSSSSTDPI